MNTDNRRLRSLLKLFDADPTDAEAAYMIAQEHATASDDHAAVEWFDRALGIDPAFHYAYYHKARALGRLDRAGDALETARDGLGRARAGAHAKASSELAALVEELSAGS